jgi:hypothetical protein
MRQGQIIGQVFIYVMAIITFGLILLFGYKAVNKLVDQANNVALIQLRQEVQSAINSIGSSPDVDKRVLNIPSKFRKICFLENTSNYDKIGSCLCMLSHCEGSGLDCCIGGNESDYYPPICNAWKSGTDQNVFLVPLAEIKIMVSKMVFGQDPGGNQLHYLCVPVKKGKVTLKLQGMGDSTQISEWT